MKKGWDNGDFWQRSVGGLEKLNGKLSILVG